MSTISKAPQGASPSQQIVQSALQVGAFAGFSGLAIGGTAGIIKSRTPVLFALASGIQCFALGATFSVARETALAIQSDRTGRATADLTASEVRTASTLGGATTGAINAAIFRGRANILPALVIWSSIGFFGQLSYDFFNERHLQQQNEDTPTESLIVRFAKSKWSPMKLLTDEEYEHMLTEKLIRVEAEIAMIDDQLKSLDAHNTSEEDVK